MTDNRPKQPHHTDFADMARARLQNRQDITPEIYQVKQEELSRKIDEALESVFPLNALASHIEFGQLPSSKKTSFRGTREIDWGQQEAFASRLDLTREFFESIYAGQVSLHVVRYAGPPTSLPLVLTCNPLEILKLHVGDVIQGAYKGLSSKFIESAVTDSDELIRCIDPTHAYSKERRVSLHECVRKAWGKVPTFVGGPNTLTIWELPMNLHTRFKESGSDQEWVFPANKSRAYVAEKGRLPGEFLSLATVLASEPHLENQLLEPGMLMVDLVGVIDRTNDYHSSYPRITRGIKGGRWHHKPGADNVLSIQQARCTSPHGNSGVCTFVTPLTS